MAYMYLYNIAISKCLVATKKKIIMHPSLIATCILNAYCNQSWFNGKIKLILMI